MRVLVTGHDGYLGHRVVAQLRARGDDVSGLDAGWYGHRALGPTDDSPPAVRADIRDVSPDLFDGIDAVVHLAGLCNDPLGDRDADVTDEINHRATARLASMARDAGVTRLVFASTCSVYGGAGLDEVDETSPVAPLTAYARSKADAEQALAALDGGLGVTCLRLGTVYGHAPRLRADLVVNNLVGWATTTGEVRLRSDGSAWRPLLHVDDAARVLVAAIRRTDRFELLDVTGPDGNHRVIDVARRVAAATGARLRVVPGARADLRSYRVSGARVRAALPDAAPTRSLDDGIAGLVDAYRAHGFQPEDLQMTLRRNAWLDHLVDEGRMGADLRWTESA